MEAGVPNITGTTLAVKFGYWYDGYSSGSFAEKQFYGNVKSTEYSSGANNNTFINNTFDASRSNAIYGNSSTVQPPSLTAIYVIKY